MTPWNSCRATKTTSLSIAAVMACACALAVPASAQVAVRIADDQGGATCRVISLTAGIPWQHERGDWTDLRGSAQGIVPFSEVKIGAPPPPSVDLDALALLRDAMSQGSRLNVLLRVVAGAPLALHSREAEARDLRPVLLVRPRGGSAVAVHPDADTALDCSSSTSLGAMPRLSLHNGSNVVMSFPLPASLRVADIAGATLRVSPHTVYGSASVLGVFRLALPGSAVITSPPGIAARYPRDAGIHRDPEVLLAEDFESPFWRFKWGQRLWPSVSRAFETGNPVWMMLGARWIRGHFDRVDTDAPLRFDALSGKALRVHIPKGEQLGIDLRYYFLDHAGAEPEAIYLRYHLRFADNWNPVDSGKLPGLAGTYGRAGWGDRPTDGTNGWSMRGYFGRPGPKGDQFQGKIPVGGFGYLAVGDTRVGAQFSWPNAGLGMLDRNRWYCIEQYVRLNDPGVPNGEIRAWVDGHLAMETRRLHFRDTNALKIETAWFDIFHGGTLKAAADMHVYIDNVVIARSYIGPMAR